MSFTTLLLLFMVLVTVLLALIFLWKPGKKQQLPSLSQFIPSELPTLVPQPSQRDSDLEQEIEIIAAMIREDEREKRRKAAIERLSELKAK